MALMTGLTNNHVTPVDLTEESINELLDGLRKLCDGPPVLKPDRIIVTKEGLELQRQRGEALGIPGAREMGPQELFDAMVRLL